MSRSVRHLVDQAVAARPDLLARPDVDAVRLFNGRSDGLDGVVIERFADVLIVQLHEGHLRSDPRQVKDLATAFRDLLGSRAVYRKWFVRDRNRPDPTIEREHRDPRPWIGDPVPAEITVVEHGLRFIVRPWDGFSVGLFLEHRGNRRRIRELAAGRRVLNTFSYTCGFSVAAAAGGAAHVASVDVSKRYLEWGRSNFAANALPVDEHRFFCSDIFAFYRRAGRQERRFDLIVLDPPTFGQARRPKRVFSIRDHLEELCAGAVNLLEPGGLILLSTNHRATGRAELESAMKAACGRRAMTLVERPGLPVDFAGDPGYARSVLVRVDGPDPDGSGLEPADGIRRAHERT